MKYKANSRPVIFRTTVTAPDNFLSPDLKDLQVRPGSILDLDADGRLDNKQMSLYRLCYLQRGYRLQFGQVIAALPSAALHVSNSLPSSQIPNMQITASTFPHPSPEDEE